MTAYTSSKQNLPGSVSTLHILACAVTRWEGVEQRQEGVGPVGGCCHSEKAPPGALFGMAD